MRVLVLAARGLHLGFLGCYGNDWVETPSFDRLAARAAVFDRHLADRPDPAGARLSWRTGRFCLPAPSDDEAPAPPAGPDLLQLLRRRGVTTRLVSDGSRETPREFLAGWDRAVAVPPDPRGATLEAVLEATGDALDELGGAGDWLLWVEPATLLPPWRVPAETCEPYLPEPDEEDEEGRDDLSPILDPAIGPLGPPDEKTFLRIRGGYAGAVTVLDAALGVLLEELQARGLDEELFLAVTADHGQALGEHGVVGPCRPWLHDEVVHLPLLLRPPAGRGAGRRVAALTQPCDLFPTLLDAFGLAPPETHGRSLLPLLSGEKDAVRPYALSGLRVGRRAEWALRTPEWAFVLPVAAPPDDPPRGPQLYVKPDDCWEVNNVVQHHPERAEQFEAALRRCAEALRGPGPFPWPDLEGPG